MARPLRITFPGAFYHITSRGNERKSVFKNERDREKFLEYLESATERYNAVIHVFCLMDNHYHILLETPSGNLPQIMRHINGAYTTYFNVKRDRSGHLFQGRYKAIVVEKDEYAKELSRYIHLNPVRAKMVGTPEEYDWSSYKYYIGKKKTYEWLKTDFILGLFGSKVSESRKRYKAFVSLLVGQKYESPLKETVGSLLLGSQHFIDYIKDHYITGLMANRDLPSIKELSPQVAIQDVCRAVVRVIGGKSRSSRNVEIYLCRKLTGEKLKSIGSHFGISDAAVSQVCKRFDKKLEVDRRLRIQVSNIKKRIKKTSEVET
jgi:REP element-mobilizing transposase RayT